MINGHLYSFIINGQVYILNIVLETCGKIYVLSLNCEDELKWFTSRKFCFHKQVTI